MKLCDTRDDFPVKISTRENSIDYYRLVETGTDTGIFTGEVILTGFAHNADGETGEDAPTQPTTSGVIVKTQLVLQTAILNPKMLTVLPFHLRFLKTIL